jgi:hypothetical protein
MALSHSLFSEKQLPTTHQLSGRILLTDKQCCASAAKSCSILSIHMTVE